MFRFGQVLPRVVSALHSVGIPSVFTNDQYTKSTRAHTHKELIREWLWEPKGSSLERL